METDVKAVFGARNLVLGIESRAERSAFYQGRTYGMNDMAQGYDPHMLDAAKLAKLSCDNVSRMTIARCWVKGFREAVRRSNETQHGSCSLLRCFRDVLGLPDNKIR